MKTYNDSDLREALRRREARQTKTEVPADFLEKTMQLIDDDLARRTRHRLTLVALAAAASIALLLTLTMGGETEPEQSGRQTAATSLHQPKKQSHTTTKQTTHVLTMETTAKPASRKKKRAAKTTTLYNESLNPLVVSVEDDLRQVSDNCYMQHLTKTIESDPQLSRMVDELVNMTSDSTQNVYCAKSF